MILRVADICKKVVGLDKVFVATDNKKNSNVVSKAGYKYIITSKKCLTGTDRVAEVSKIKSKVYINVQGDEPTINPSDINRILNAKKNFPIM